MTKPTKAARTRRPAMNETKAMNAVAKQLEALTEEERARVVKWIAEKYGPKQ